MMPAAKHGDMQLGVDIHLCIVPPGVPAPLPTLHMSVVFDPFDYIPCIGATVSVCGMKRATAGTAGIAIHIPPGFPFAKPPDKDDELFMGSSTVDADGDPMSHIAHPVLSCQVVGMLAPFRIRKKGGPRISVLPTVFNLAIPTNVFIGGPPTISLMGLATKGLMAGLGKLAKSKLAGKLAKKFKKARKKLANALGLKKPGFLRCTILRAEPVNLLDGSVVVEQEDFSLPGHLPIAWTRSYSSGQTDQAGVLGPGWQTLADTSLALDAESGEVTIQTMDGGNLFFDRLPAGSGPEHAVTELMDGSRLEDLGDTLQLTTSADRIYTFAKAGAWRSPSGDGYIPVSRIADRCGNAWTFEYRDYLPVAIHESSGRKLVLAYAEGMPRLASVSLVDPQSGSEHSLVRYNFDELGRLREVIDPLDAAYRFDYGNDASQYHMLRHTDRNGLAFHYAFEPGPDDELRVVHAWGEHGLYDYRFAYLDELRERRITDSLGHVSIVKLDENDLPISEIDPLGGMTTYTYDAAGRTSSVTDPAGRRTAYTYDDSGNLLVLERPDGASLGASFNAQGKPLSITDPNGATWQQEWDERGLLVAQTSPLGHASQFEYDAHGQLVAVTNPRAATTRLAFDAQGNLSGLQDAQGATTRFIHDALGNLTSRTDALGRQTRYRYDAKSRLLAVQLPSGSAIQCAYDGEDNLIRYTDENGATTTLEYFGQGELARRIQPDGHVVEYLYDTEEQLIGVRNQRGETYHLQRDALGRVVEEVDYWGQSRRYAYDPGGYLSASLDPLGQRIDYQCDPLGRITSKLLPLPPDAAEGTPRPGESFAYDANGNLVATANAQVKVSREFDAEGRLTAEAQAHTTGECFALANAYDAVGNRIKRETSSSTGSSHTIEFSFDLLDQLSAARLDGNAPIRLTHDALGQLIGEELAPGLQREFAYDTDGQLTAQRTSAGGQLLFATGYSYDPAGNLTRREDSEFGLDQYVYDPLGRIVSHTDPQGKLQRFFNDPAGDRLVTQVHGAGSVAAEAGKSDDWHRIGQHEGTHYRFDRAGNLTHRKEADGTLTTLNWDANQRLIASTRTPAGGQPATTSYAYDPLGRRLYKETADHKTWFGWDGDAMAMDVIAGQAREFVYRPESFEPLAMLGVTNSALLYINDPNGCPTRLIDTQGQVHWAASYAAWGGITRLHAERVDNPLRLQGQYADSETGLHYNRHRYFDAGIGAFISQDPLGLAAGSNIFAYANNAFAWNDPLGLKKCNISANAKQVLGNAPPIKNPHLHHIVMEGAFTHWKPANRKLVEDARDILRKRKIDIQDVPNIVWAQNAGHSIEYARKVRDRLTLANKKGKAAVLSELSKIGNILSKGGTL
ncbi:MAG: RHS repeat-associated core domain-containing protein [Azonexus sp.]